MNSSAFPEKQREDLSTINGNTYDMTYMHAKHSLGVTPQPSRQMVAHDAHRHACFRTLINMGLFYITVFILVLHGQPYLLYMASSF